MEETAVFTIETENIEEGVTSKITYSGKLTQVDSKPEAIFMHLGYGLLWENLQEIKLDKVYDEYEADITFATNGDMYFCFRTPENEWDNNDGLNYCINIRKSMQSLIRTEAVPIEVPKPKKAYLIKKKIKIVFFKTISFLGKLVTGNIRKENLFM